MDVVPTICSIDSGGVIMHPDVEAPLLLPDEVGVRILDFEVVDGLNSTGVLDAFAADPLALAGQQPVAELEFAGGDPALAPRVERVFRRRADYPVADLHIQDRADAGERLQYPLLQQRTGRVVFVPTENRVAVVAVFVVALHQFYGLARAVRQHHRRASDEAV